MKTIPGYEDRYCATEYGQIYSLRQEQLVKPHPNDKGYLVVKLWDGYENKAIKVHRLIALAYHGPCPKNKQVNHIDHNKLNNCPSNLEYVTGLQNARKYQKHVDPSWTAKRGTKRGPKPMAVIARQGGSEVRYDSVLAAVAAGFTAAGVSQCLHGRIRRHKGWSFQKAD